VWTPEILKLMTVPGMFNNGVKVTRGGRSPYYANGIWVGPSWIAHPGGSKGFTTYFAHNGSKGLSLAMLCNRGEINPFKQADALAAALDLSPITEPAVQETVIAGRYRSNDLEAIYVLELGPSETLNVTVLGGDGSTRRRIDGLKRTPMGSNGDSDLEIVPDDDVRGLTIKSGRSTYHFLRDL
jgi:hypothetical protein